jgi:hypothetical protein
MAIGLINSIMKGTYLEILSINALIVVAVYAVDGNILMRNQKTKMVEYAGLDYIHPDKQPQLIIDLKERTGLNIQRISIEQIDFTKNRAIIKIYYL